MLTLAKSLVSLCYYADGVGKGCSHRGTQETGASGRLALPDPIEPDSDWGMVVKNLPGWAKESLITKEEESEPFITRQHFSTRLD